jgi:type IV pilus assembly protein PilA
MRLRRLVHRGFTLVELMVVVAIVSVLASVAIPSFIKYLARAKTSEARGQLNKMYSAARVYYLETFGARQITGVAHQFPGPVATTPAVTCCASGLGKCAPDADLWTEPSWIALHFSMDDPHYYRYSFLSQGTNIGSTFTARAVGDLDCDGLESTFEMFGQINAQGEPQGSGSVVRLQELE